jgi:two-component system, OmpR family, response regulator
MPARFNKIYAEFYNEFHCQHPTQHTVRILLALEDSTLLPSLSKSLRAMGAIIDELSQLDRLQAALANAAPFEVIVLQAPAHEALAQERIKRFRALAGTSALMVLTRTQDVQFKILAWDSGADDVMSIPLVMPEFEARVRALVRRHTGALQTVIRHGPLSYDQVGRVVKMGDKMLELSARELSLLEVLLQRSGRMVSKDQLVEWLCQWGEEVSPNAIEVYIHRLRKKVEIGPVRILTVRGIGYCLEKISMPPPSDSLTLDSNALTYPDPEPEHEHEHEHEHEPNAFAKAPTTSASLE